MPDSTAPSGEITLGFLQKRNRFYGWNKRLFSLNHLGFAMLMSERDGKLSKHGISKGSTIAVIGDVAEIDPSACLLFKRKLLIEFHAISAVTTHGQKDFAVTSTTGTIVLRTMSTRDRDKWVAVIRSAVAKHDGLNSHSANRADDKNTEASAIHARPTTAFSPGDESLDHCDAEKLPGASSLDGIEPALEDDELEPTSVDGPGAAVPQQNKAAGISQDRAPQNNHHLDIGGFQDNGDWMQPSGAAGAASGDDLFLRPYNASVALVTDKVSLREQHTDSTGHVPESTTLGFLGSGNSSNRLSLAQLDMPLADTEDFDASMFFAEGSSIVNMQPVNAPQRAARNLGSATVPNLYQKPTMPMPASNSVDATQTSAPDLTKSPHSASPQSNGGQMYGDIFGSFMSPPSMALPYGSNMPQSSGPAHAPFRSNTGADQGNYQDNSGDTDDGDYGYGNTSGLCINKSLGGVLDKLQMGDNGDGDDDDGDFIPGIDHAVPMSQSTKPAQLQSVPTTATITALSTPSCDLGIQEWSSFMEGTPPLQVAGFNKQAAHDTTSTMDSEQTPCGRSTVGAAGKEHRHGFGFDAIDENGEKPAGRLDAKQAPSPIAAARLSAKTQQALSEMRLQKSEANLLASPGNQRIGVRQGGLFKSSTTQTAADGPNAPTRKNAPTALGGQLSIRAKFSDINASKAFASAVGRISRSRTTAEYRGSDSEAKSRCNTEPAVIPQYEPADQVDSEVTRVVKGQVARNVIQRENERDSQERRSGIRRMRRVKSESKVPRLKSIRLRLDGSAVGRQVPSYSEYDDDFSPRQSIDVEASGLPSVAGAGHFTGNKFVPKSPLGYTETAGGRLERSALGNNSQCSVRSTADVMGEFNEIQNRLKTAEELKRNEKIKRVFAKEGADDMRISSILETRQEIPLALQLQEKRQMQLAKQQALMKQELEIQKKQQHVEQQQREQRVQHQRFLQQSLRPAASACSPSQKPAQPIGAWQSSDVPAYGGSDAYTRQWVQNQGHFNGGAPPPPPMPQQQQQQQRQYRPGYASSVHSMGPTPSAHHNSHHRLHHHHQSTGSYAHVPPVPPMPPAHQRPISNIAGYVNSGESAAIWSQNRSVARSFSFHSRIGSGMIVPSGEFSRAPLSRSQTVQSRRTAGGAFRPGKAAMASRPDSPVSVPSSESWQSNVDHNATHNAGEPAYEGSMYTTSPVMSIMTAPRGGSSSHCSDRRRRTHYNTGDVPPVPTLPPKIVAMNNANPTLYHQSQVYHHPPHAPSRLSQHSMVVPPRNTTSPYLQQQQQHQAPPNYYPGSSYGAKMDEKNVAELQRQMKRRTEMTATAPSLLQRLDMARMTGVLPTRGSEKAMPYTSGAYQNYTGRQMVHNNQGGAAAAMGGTGLLVDRVHETEINRNAFIRKMSHGYPGVGGEGYAQQVYH